MGFSAYRRQSGVRCVLACTSPVAVHPQSSLSAGYEPAAIAGIVRQARIGGVPWRATESVSAGAWAISFDAEILVQETPLVHLTGVITHITKSPLSPALMADLLCTSTHLYAPSQDGVMTSMLHDLVRGPAPSTGPELCWILDMDFPEFHSCKTLGK
jgi:hypothetical protein